VTSPPAGAVCPSLRRRGERQVCFMYVAIFAFKSPPYKVEDPAWTGRGFRGGCFKSLFAASGSFQKEILGEIIFAFKSPPYQGGARGDE
jgi:hypothetical protein